MKKLLFILFTSMTFILSAQTTETINIDWGFNSVPTSDGNANSSRTIEVGDTVTWNWYSNGTHNVVSRDTANEEFSSELMSMGATFSYTFQNVGENPYRCTPHPDIMFGTITVVAEGTLSNPRTDAPVKFAIFPNPSAEFMNISIPDNFLESLKLEVFDILGKRVYTQQLNNLNSRINISKWNSGIYLVRLNSSNETAALTKRFVKL